MTSSLLHTSESKKPIAPGSLAKTFKAPKPGMRRCKTCHDYRCTPGCSKECAGWLQCPTKYYEKHKAEADAKHQRELSDYYAQQNLAKQAQEEEKTKQMMAKKKIKEKQAEEQQKQIGETLSKFNATTKTFFMQSRLVAEHTTPATNHDSTTENLALFSQVQQTVPRQETGSIAKTIQNALKSAPKLSSVDIPSDPSFIDAVKAVMKRKKEQEERKKRAVVRLQNALHQPLRVEMRVRRFRLRRTRSLSEIFHVAPGAAQDWV